MSNFVHYKDCTPVNLDFVVSFCIKELTNKKWIIDYYTGSLVTKLFWEFGSKEEAERVYTKLLDTDSVDKI
jgi:hypothetical protein